MTEAGQIHTTPQKTQTVLKPVRQGKAKQGDNSPSEERDVMGMQNAHKTSPKDTSYVTKKMTAVGGWTGVDRNTRSK